MTKKLLTLAALAVVLTSAFAGSAKADRWHDHEVRAHRYYHPRGRVVVEQAPAVYAPPVVYAPPPEPVSTGINLVLPLHFN